MKPIKVVDSIMGSGKTSAIIQMINNSREEKYIFVTPFLDEVDRIEKECSSKQFYSPHNYTKDKKSARKMDSLIELLSEGKNIATTHALFEETQTELIELIREHNYTLILDETMNVLETITLTKPDQDLLFDNNIIFKDNKGFIHWNLDNPKAEEYYGKFSDIKKKSLNKNLVAYDDKTVLWTFPHETFKAFKECYILTYIFDGQLQKYYFDLHGIPYEKYTVRPVDGFGGRYYKIVRGDNREEDFKKRTELKDKIKIYEGKYNDIGEGKFALCMSWYKKKHPKGKDVKKLASNMDGFFEYLNKAKAKERFWTTFKDFKDKFEQRYNGQLLACNIRATNDYKDCTYVAYTINRFMNPLISNYFAQRSCTVNQDLWAVSELVQFIFRSAIREGEEIHLYIPSKRMRSLLEDWLDGKDIESTYEVPANLPEDTE